MREALRSLAQLFSKSIPSPEPLTSKKLQELQLQYGVELFRRIGKAYLKNPAREFVRVIQEPSVNGVYVVSVEIPAIESRKASSQLAFEAQIRLCDQRAYTVVRELERECKHVMAHGDIAIQTTLRHRLISAIDALTARPFHVVLGVGKSDKAYSLDDFESFANYCEQQAASYLFRLEEIKGYDLHKP